MTKQEFLILKRQIDRLLQKAEDEALAEGVDITSSEFLVVFKELKRKILAERGINLEEYEKLEEETYSVGKIGDALKNMAGVLDEQTEKEKDESRQRIIELQEEYSAKIDVLKEEEDNKIQSLKEEKDTEKKELLNEIRILVNKLKRQEDISNKQIKELRELNEKIIRADIRKDTEIYNLQESIKNIIKTEDNIKKKVDGIERIKPEKLSQKDIDSSVARKFSDPLFQQGLNGKINKEIQEAIIEPARRLGMGLRGRIDTKLATTNFVDAETPTGSINGSNQTFTLNYAPNPTTSLKVYRNGIRQELTTHYTLSGQTLTTVVALPTGTNLKVDYKK